MTADSLVRSSAFPPNPVAALLHRTMVHELMRVVLGYKERPVNLHAAP
jgi:hypothetical protein